MMRALVCRQREERSTWLFVEEDNNTNSNHQTLVRTCKRDNGKGKSGTLAFFVAKWKLRNCRRRWWRARDLKNDHGMAVGNPRLDKIDQMSSSMMKANKWGENDHRITGGNPRLDKIDHIPPKVCRTSWCLCWNFQCNECQEIRITSLGSVPRCPPSCHRGR